jgi:leucyl/phenylalanyl-tRNA--protein transferase
MTGLIRFPDPRDAPYGDIVAIGGPLNSANLLQAYSKGIFPWPMEGLPLTWFCPEERGILDFQRLHVPRSLRRLQRRAPFRFTLDQDFVAVIEACARTERPHEEGTWITAGMLRAYKDLHRLGHAHSVEAWEGSQLVGGLYGVDASGSFAGESMFYLRPNASKLALLFLIEHLSSRGLDWLDIQMVTPHMQALGAHTISRHEFLLKLARTQALHLKLFDKLDQNN